MNAAKINNPDGECGVDEEVFPLMDKCCRKSSAPFSASYEKICPDCDIAASFPYGASLKTVIIFECSRFAYGKRITE